VTAANIEIPLFYARNAPFAWSRHFRSFDGQSHEIRIHQPIEK
jgi:hypothetical protein